MKRKIDYLVEGGLRIISPPEDVVAMVTDHSRKTGDIERVSRTDLEVIALAKHLNGTILSDDYSIQNIAKSLSLPYKTLSERGIEQVFHWELRCRGCGRYYRERHDECPICGSELRTCKK